MRISVWSSDVCSSDLLQLALAKLQFLGRTSLVGDIVHHQTEAAQAAVLVEQRGQRDIGNEDAAILAAAHVARPETARRARRRKPALPPAGRAHSAGVEQNAAAADRFPRRPPAEET